MINLNKLNVLIPMAGLGSRFAKEGFNNIKPLIPLNGKTFIEWSIDSVDFPDVDCNFIFVVMQCHYEELKTHLKKVKPNCSIFTVETLTRGAVETALTASELINNDTPLIVTNCDQIFEWNKQKYLEYLQSSNVDANVVTVKANTDKFSYILLNEEGYGTKLTEKEIISDEALAGIHFWRYGKDFVSSGTELINRNIRSNNEFYISLSYNILIEQGVKVTAYRLDNETEKYLSIGTPEQMFQYLDYKGLTVKKYNLRDFINGWFIGDFEPSLLKGTGVELAVMHKRKGVHKDEYVYHYHEHCKEINVLVKGKIKLKDQIIEENEIFVYDPFVPSIIEYLEDCTIVVFKDIPSNNDKIVM